MKVIVIKRFLTCKEKQDLCCASVFSRTQKQANTVGIVSEQESSLKFSYVWQILIDHNTQVPIPILYWFIDLSF